MNIYKSKSVIKDLFKMMFPKPCLQHYAYASGILLGLFLFAGLGETYAQSTDGKYHIDFMGSPTIKELESGGWSDTLVLKFNLYQDWESARPKRVRLISDQEAVSVSVSERIGEKLQSNPPEFKSDWPIKRLKEPGGTGDAIPENITISLVVDQSGSLDQASMDKINEAIAAFVNNVPDGCLFLSEFSSDITNSKPLTRSNISANKIGTTNKHTALYNAIYAKLLEFDSTAAIPDMGLPGLRMNPELARRGSDINYLIVLTDGKNDVESILRENPAFKPVENLDLEMAVRKFKNQHNGKVFTLGFGDRQNLNEVFLRKIAGISGNPDGYFFAKSEGILELLKGEITNALIPDYELRLWNPPGKTYTGSERSLDLTISEAKGFGGGSATGSVSFALGSKLDPIETGKKSIGGTLLIGLLAGFIFLLVMMILIQLIIPLIKNKIFNIKYVKKYQPAAHEIRKECPYCGDPMNPGELVVMKCKHVVHKVCWRDYDNMCPEYGQNCDIGKQDYFDISDPFSKKNKIYYLKWVLYGLIGGFL